MYIEPTIGWSTAHGKPTVRLVDKADIAIMKVIASCPRNPLYALDPAKLLDLLAACDAEIIRTPPHSGDPKDETEGYVLFAEQNRCSRIFIPIDGSVVFFHSGQAKVAYRGFPSVTISTLRNGQHVFAGYVGPGQVAGLTELLTSYIQQNAEPDSDDLEQLQRRHALLKARLSVRSGDNWLSSGFVSRNTTVLSIPTKNLKAEIIRRQLLENYGEFLRRCNEEMALRANEQETAFSITARGMRPQLLARYLYEYCRITNKVEIVCSYKRLAWFMNLSNPDEAGMLLKTLCDCEGEHGNILKRLGDPKRSMRYRIDPRGVLLYSMKPKQLKTKESDDDRRCQETPTQDGGQASAAAS